MDDLQPKTVVVNGRTYILQKFLADKGLSVFIRLAKLIAPAVAQMTPKNGEDVATQAAGELDPSRFGDQVQAMIDGLATRLNESEVKALIEDLLSTVLPEGQTYPLADPNNPARGNWRVHFQGRLADMFVVAYYATMENFEDFLFALRAVGVKTEALSNLKFPGRST